jgi:hypothetical protein
VSPEPAAVSDAPLRLDRPTEQDGETEDPSLSETSEGPAKDIAPTAPEEAESSAPEEAESSAPEDAETAAPEEHHTPAGPPPLREPGDEPVVVARKDRDHQDTPSEPVPELVPEVDPAVDPTPTRAERRAAAAAEAAAIAAATPEAPSRRQRKQAAKRRARKVKRIVRRLDAWSVMKVAFIFNLCVYVVSMVAVVVLWNVAASAGVIDNVESFIEDLGAFETFQFQPDQLLQATALGGAVLAVLATGLIALGAVLFNLISDLVGGIRLTVIEEPGSVPLKKPRSGGTDAGASGTVSEPSGTSDH